MREVNRPSEPPTRDRPALTGPSASGQETSSDRPESSTRPQGNTRPAGQARSRRRVPAAMRARQGPPGVPAGSEHQAGRTPGRRRKVLGGLLNEYGIFTCSRASPAVVKCGYADHSGHGDVVRRLRLTVSPCGCSQAEFLPRQRSLHCLPGSCRAKRSACRANQPRYRLGEVAHRARFIAITFAVAKAVSIFAVAGTERVRSCTVTYTVLSSWPVASGRRSRSPTPARTTSPRGS
jgi:hypothetical protein